MSVPSDDIALPLGRARSGRARYGAAMTLYNAGRLSPQALEIYRTCSLLDAADPAPMLAALNLEPARIAELTAEMAIRALLAEADRYLATLQSPGVAEARQGLNCWSQGKVTAKPAANTVVDAHLPAALTQIATTRPDLAACIADAAPHLHWITYDLYDPAQIGAVFPKNHAFAALLGADGAIPAQDFDLGLFLIAPHVLYRDHHHLAPELYATLTGPHGWRFGPNRPLVIKPAHVPVWNDPDRPHLTKVGPTPFLALFAWTADVNAAAQVIPATDWPALEALRLDP